MEKQIKMARASNSKGLPASLRQRLKESRRNLKLSQDDLGKATGVTQAQISDIETGKTDARFSTLLEIARALDLEPVFVPRKMAVTLETFINPGKETSSQPLYSSEAFSDDNE